MRFGASQVAQTGVFSTLYSGARMEGEGKKDLSLVDKTAQDLEETLQTAKQAREQGQQKVLVPKRRPKRAVVSGDTARSRATSQKGQAQDLKGQQQTQQQQAPKESGVGEHMLRRHMDADSNLSRATSQFRQSQQQNPKRLSANGMRRQMVQNFKSMLNNEIKQYVSSSSPTYSKQALQHMSSAMTGLVEGQQKKFTKSDSDSRANDRGFVSTSSEEKDKFLMSLLGKANKIINPEQLPANYEPMEMIA